MEFTESVKSFQVPGHTLHDRLSAELAIGTHFAGHARYFGSERTGADPPWY